ncbi:hypothetical protein ACS5PJ_19740 [Pseudarthrobacter sp. YS3]|uniref:hypothetical protein n=1 Tax=Pseudarthrobacter sp. YS3 TaxID=3453718 RepID=UPI003EE908EB
MDPGERCDVEPVTEQAPILEQVVDNIPGEIHQFVDRRLNRWSRHKSTVLPGTDSPVELAGVSSGWAAVMHFAMHRDLHVRNLELFSWIQNCSEY